MVVGCGPAIRSEIMVPIQVSIWGSGAQDPV